MILFSPWLNLKTLTMISSPTCEYSFWTQLILQQLITSCVRYEGDDEPSKPFHVPLESTISPEVPVTTDNIDQVDPSASKVSRQDLAPEIEPQQGEDGQVNGGGGDQATGSAWNYISGAAQGGGHDKYESQGPGIKEDG